MRPRLYSQKNFTKNLLALSKKQNQSCCDDSAECDFPVQDNFQFPVGEVGTPFEYEYTLHGTLPFNVIVVQKPDWMTITVNNTTGVISFTGTPVAEGNQIVAFSITGCNQNVSLDGQFVVFPIDLGVTASLVNFDDEPTGEYLVGVFNVDQEFLGDANDDDEYAALWNADPANAALGSITPTGTPFQFLFVPINNSPTPSLYGLPFVEYPLLNFNDDPVPSTPYGLFNGGDESFISLAANGAAAATSWNGVVAFNDVALAAAIPGNDLAIGLYLKTSDTLPDMKALRYWTIDAVSGTPTIYLSGNTYVRRANNVLVKSNTGTANVYSSFGMNASTYGTGGSIPLVDTSSPNFGVTLTAGTNYVFHSEDGQWAWCDVFGAFANNTGYIPATVRFLAIHSFGASNITRNLRLNNFSNYLSAFSNVRAVSFNGAPVVYDPTWINLMPLLETWQLIDTASTLRELGALNLSATSTPNLKWIGYRRNNSGAILSSNPSWWASLPTLEKGIDMVGVQLDSTALVDEAFNNLGTSQATTVTEANARLTIQSQNATRSSASDAAVAILTARPYVIA